MVAKKGRRVEEEGGGQGREGGFSGLPKLLASPDKKVRERAIQLLVAWLSAQKKLTDLDLKKIWKGLFYCVWHSDKAAVQADLIQRLASLLLRLDLKIALQFFDCFVSTMRREWGGIDRLRLDKFYLLIRQFLGSMFKVLHTQNWNEEWVSKFMTTLKERLFLASDLFPAHGVSLHVAEVFWSELKPFLPITKQAFGCFLEPFYFVLGQASDKILLERIKESVFMPLLKEAGNLQSSTEKGDCLEFSIGVLTLEQPLAIRFFELAASSTVAQRNRKILYSLYEESSKLQKPQVVTEGFASQRQKLGSESEPGSGDIEADSYEIAQMSKKKKRKSKNGSPCKKSNGMDSATMALKKGSDVATANGSMTEVLEDLHLSLSNERLSYLEDCTSAKKGTGKKKQAAVESHLKNKMTKENPHHEKICGPSSLKKKKSLTGNSGQKESGIDTEMEATNGCLEQSTCLSNEANLNGIQGQQGESENAVEAVDGVDTGDHLVTNLSKKFNFAASDDTIDSPIAFFQAFSQLSRSPRNTGSKKRKKIELEKTPCQTDEDGEASEFSPLVCKEKQESSGSEKKVKKVRFSLKHNLAWKPKSPLPPQSLRLPPSSTPRGSALKKGVPPGPIKASVTPEMPMKNVILRNFLSDSSLTSQRSLPLKRNSLLMKRLNLL
ncbi:hypothetical protein O6H91_10G107300 [Diphasiastrum complanatum]|uniref:Uncharacterized protein n=1 Tax=Diphasiastrum complanatum TaxID=34168 RepID=A0ACC2CKE2_DIPCM|nr:hypothetical protein O6H91_10G107300 [Diphasiastrum complanatum]